MKLEKFKKNNLRNKKILYSIIGVIVLICGVILFKSFAFFESKYDFNVIKGRIPEFNGGDIQLAFTIDGVKSDGVFPSKNDIYIAKSVTCQNGVTASWNNTTWSLENIEPNGNKKISCNIDFGKSLYKIVNIGDLVSYTPSKTSYTISKSLTAYSSDQKINPSELDIWRVIRKNADGTVELISEYVSSTVVYFYGTTGYSNYYTVLDTISKQYETSGITSGSWYIGNNQNDLDLVKAAMKENGLKAQTKKQKGTSTYSSYFIRERYDEVWSSVNHFQYIFIIDNTGNVWSSYNQAGSVLYYHYEYSTPKDVSLDLNYGVRPIIKIKSGILISNNGNGSSSSPYKIN